MEHSIIISQNEETSIRYLAAQRELYSNAKNLFAVQLLLTTVAVVVFSFLNMFYNLEIIFASYCFFILIADACCLNGLISNKKEKAALIQEIFDTKVLKIEWNNILDPVDHEIIYRQSEKYKKKEPSLKSLKNWYSLEIKKIDNEDAKIICQYSNFRYDLSLRKSFSCKINLLLFSSALLVVIFSLIKDVSINSFIVSVLFPLLPIFIFYIQRTQENNLSVKNLEKLKRITSEAWQKVISQEQIDLEIIARKVQDSIYQNRVNSPLIFDWFYKRYRDNLEEEMNFSVSQLLSEYKTSKEIKKGDG